MTESDKRDLLNQLKKENLSHYVIHDVITVDKNFPKNSLGCDVRPVNGSTRLAVCPAFVRGKDDGIYGITAQRAVRLGETYELVCQCDTCRCTGNNVKEPFEAVSVDPPKQGTDCVGLLRPTTDANPAGVQHMAVQTDNFDALSKFT